MPVMMQLGFCPSSIFLLWKELSRQGIVKVVELLVSEVTKIEKAYIE